MDISNWSWGQILELPRHLLGRRFPIGCSAFAVGLGEEYDISEMGLPERCVIHELLVTYAAEAVNFGNCSLALGDVLPTTDDEFNGMEQLFKDVGLRTGLRRDITAGMATEISLRNLKIGVNAGGRRLIMRYGAIFSGVTKMDAVITVSSVPRSLPEWFV